MDLNKMTEPIIGAATDVHKTLGPGLLGGWQIGLLINFNVPVLKSGVKRIVNTFEESSAPLR